MILISVVGDYFSNVVPIFYEFRDRIKQHILVFDEKDKKAAKKISDGLIFFVKKYNLDIELLEFPIDEDSRGSMQQLINLVESKSPLDNAYFNLSDGHHAITIYLVDLLKGKDSKFIVYDKKENEYLLIEKDKTTKFVPKKSLSIIEHLNSKGLTVLSYKTANEILSRKSLIESVMSRFHEFSKLKYYAAHTKRVKIKNKRLKDDLINLGVIDTKGFVKDLTYLNGVIFEEYISSILLEYNIEELLCGCVIAYDKEQIVKNEFDILFMKDNHLHMIECKMKNNLRSEMDILTYKYDSLISVLDDDSKAMIINLKGFKENGVYIYPKRTIYFEIGYYEFHYPEKEKIEMAIESYFGIQKK